MTDKLMELAQHAMGFAEECFIKSGSLAPMWIADTPEGRMIIGAEVFDDNTKDAVLAAIKEQVDPIAERIVSVSEAWALELNKDDFPSMEEAEKEIARVRPSESPNRIEIIHVLAEDRTGRAVVITREIKREGKKTELLPAKTVDCADGEVGGRFVGLLTPTKRVLQ